MLQNISTKKRSRLCIADGYKNLEQEAENMTTLSLIKSKVMYLIKTNPKVHIDISNRSDRTHLTNVPAVITGVYPNIFTARLKENDVEKNYTFQYVDLLTHTMEIKELNKLM